MLCMSTQIIHAADLKSEKLLKSKIEETMQLLVKGNLNTGIRNLVPHTIRPKIHTDASINQLIKHRNKYNREFGRSLRFHLANTTRIGQSLVKFEYTEQLESKVLKWTFTAYKPREIWKILTFKWDDKIDGLFK